MNPLYSCLFIGKIDLERPTTEGNLTGLLNLPVSGSIASMIGVCEGHGGIVRSAQFSPDGSKIVTAFDAKTARLWGNAPTTQISVDRGKEDIVCCLTPGQREQFHLIESAALPTE